jgi:ataxia telangiectasia mutated family protein
MGIVGCEGVFKRGCEKTLTMLRDEKDIIFTLLDVFRHDPLYSWYTYLS